LSNPTLTQQRQVAVFPAFVRAVLGVLALRYGNQPDASQKPASGDRCTGCRALYSRSAVAQKSFTIQLIF